MSNNQSRIYTLRFIDCNSMIHEDFLSQQKLGDQKQQDVQEAEDSIPTRRKRARYPRRKKGKDAARRARRRVDPENLVFTRTTSKRFERIPTLYRWQNSFPTTLIVILSKAKYMPTTIAVASTPTSGVAIGFLVAHRDTQMSDYGHTEAQIIELIQRYTAQAGRDKSTEDALPSVILDDLEESSSK
ncbi:uncharacterized protein RHIMIDRAFT_293490 [Rhizopus microsporus ATCC 52813]|uniref:Uncharacterized protein n=1 Tax=Rhizopus microsporus ATCC 52813 TaxID=1340429 RepID=A0A2G4SPN2_RHIZD|nr:uncharacterized protein RHIMIDRAFT_293490 [Rhizopus microsporus ATCC 52813]PHZ10720.1 hypothetical protein RHIMIDRAFT_293490 [Rhizopus microsporus ATCC 52813]